MKKNIVNLLFLASILSVGNILNANNQNVSKDVKKPMLKEAELKQYQIQQEQSE